MHPGEKQEVPGGHPGRGVRGQGREESRGWGVAGAEPGPAGMGGSRERPEVFLAGHLRTKVGRD